MTIKWPRNLTRNSWELKDTPSQSYCKDQQRFQTGYNKEYNVFSHTRPYFSIIAKPEN